MKLWKSSQNFQSHKIEKKNAQKGLFGDASVHVLLSTIYATAGNRLL